MSIEPTEFVDLGRSLVEESGGEPTLRTGVGRIYYGLFLGLRDALNVRARTREAHDDVATQLGRRTKRATAQKYRELKDLRELADYEPSEGQWDRKAVKALRLYEDIMEEVLRRKVI